MTRLALLVVTAFALAACGGATKRSPSVQLPGSGAAGAANPAAASGGATVQMRFVSLMPPGDAPVDVVSGDAATGKKLLSGVQAGAVSDYIAVPTTGPTFLVSDGQTLATLTYPSGSVRQTVAIGMDGSGSAVNTEFVERAGKVTSTAGDVGVDALDVPAGKALVLASGLGNGSLSAMSDGGDGFLLGQPGKGCLGGPGQSGDSKSTVGTQVNFYADPGAADLAWFGDLSCADAVSAPAHVTLAAGQYAYAFTWFADATHLHLLYVPVQASGSGTAGVVDSGEGPTFPGTGSPSTPSDSAAPTD